MTTAPWVERSRGWLQAWCEMLEAWAQCRGADLVWMPESSAAVSPRED